MTSPDQPTPPTDFKGRCLKCGKQLGTSAACSCELVQSACTPPTQPLPASVEEGARQLAMRFVIGQSDTPSEIAKHNFERELGGHEEEQFESLVSIILAFARTVHSAELTEAKRQRDCERSIKEAEKKILITEIENHTVCRARLAFARTVHSAGVKPVAGATPETDAFMKREHVAIDSMWEAHAKSLEARLSASESAPAGANEQIKFLGDEHLKEALRLNDSVAREIQLRTDLAASVAEGVKLRGERDGYWHAMADLLAVGGVSNPAELRARFTALRTAAEQAQQTLAALYSQLGDTRLQFTNGEVRDKISETAAALAGAGDKQEGAK